MNRIILLCLLLTAVTAPCRYIPMLFMGNRKVPPFVNSLFYYIPYAVLGALVFPDILTSTGDMATAIVGAIAAFAVGLFSTNPMFSLLAAIAAAYAASQIF